MVSTRTNLPARNPQSGNVAAPPSFNPQTGHDPRPRKRRRSPSPSVNGDASAKRRHVGDGPTHQLARDDSAVTLLDASLTASNIPRTQPSPHSTQDDGSIGQSTIHSQYHSNTGPVPNNASFLESSSNSLLSPQTASGFPSQADMYSTAQSVGNMNTSGLGYGILQVRIQSLPFLENIVSLPLPM